MIVMGLRPEWPPKKPRKRLLKQTVACWNQKPNERPTAFEVLKALLAPSKGQLQEPAVSAGDQAMTMEQVHINDYPEECTFLDR